jgi:hypothetical protein
MSAPVTDAVGVPETLLPPHLVEQLPSDVAPAPWRARCSITMWWHGASRAALDVLPAAIRPERLRAVAWVLVQYHDTPVGPYSEIAAMPLPVGLRPTLHLPFIAVDSLLSIVGGRSNWLLPKALASFDWRPGGASVHGQEPAEPAWWLDVDVAPVGPPVPYVMPYSLHQVGADGAPRRFRTRLSGLARYAHVEVTGSADGPLSTLLRSGHHRGAVVRKGSFHAGPLEPPRL